MKRRQTVSGWRGSGPKIGVLEFNPENPLMSMLPVKRLEECKTPIAISTFSTSDMRTKVFTTGPIHDVVVASCTVHPPPPPLRIPFKPSKPADNPPRMSISVGTYLLKNKQHARRKRYRIQTQLTTHDLTSRSHTP
eukprot:TRINITY_DN29188_c0_g1_i1.p1 TRINITY_DN29188_c0_g1~~TRINITY_DN29188_c0_g1_i1.p1  ORF type:complete len:136 (-),score=4.11 TRINITY_DN29188_c0_g1_i1:22-429(-)